MKICLLGDIGSIHLQRWANQLAKLGHNVSVISFRTASVPDNIKVYQVKSRVPTKLKYLTSIRVFKEIIREINPDIVHSHYLTSYGFIGACVGFRPYVVSAWGTDVLISPKRNLMLNFFIRFVLNKADLVHSLAKFVEKELISLGAEPSKIIIFPFGIDNSALEGSKRKVNTSRQSPVIISTRRLEPVYNVGLLIRAMPYVLEKNKVVKCLIAGGGSQVNEFRQLARELKVENSIEFLGELNHNRILECLGGADIFISTSLSDINNISLNEAMVYGLFPICTDIPANREWIDDGVNGFLVPTDSPVKLAQKIAEACRDKGLREGARKINLNIINKHAILDKNILKVEKMYRELVEG